MKEKNPNVKVVLADPQGSVLFNHVKHGKLERSEGSSITEGIGQGRVTDNFSEAPVDDAVCVLDTDAVHMVSSLVTQSKLKVPSLNTSIQCKVVVSPKIAQVLCMRLDLVKQPGCTHTTGTHRDTAFMHRAFSCEYKLFNANLGKRFIFL